MNNTVGVTSAMAADQVLEFLHFHFHYGMGATPHEHAAIGQVAVFVAHKSKYLEIRVADQRLALMQ